MPRERFIGWDFKPLPEGFIAPAKLALQELAKRVKDELNTVGRRF